MVHAEHLTVGEIPSTVARLRKAFADGRTRTLEWRRRQLEGLKAMLVEHEAEALAALEQDLGRPEYEGLLAEIVFTKGEIEASVKRLPRWMRPERVHGHPLAVQPASSQIVKEPYGLVLVISPWNYPLQLALGPLIGAIAAGNAAIVKPSELAPRTSAFLAKHLATYVDKDAIAVIEGGVPETTRLLEERFDYIFYTGSTHVGAIVMQAAAKHLTPVTLELGGKSPCLVDRTADLEVAARRIVWGKFFNAGQTCVAPDYVLAHEAIAGPLVDHMKAALRAFYGDDPAKSPDFGRIVNARHHQRLVRLLASGEAVVGGQHDEAKRYLAPTILRNVAPTSPVMKEEIFGPILPVLEVGSMDQAIEFVNAREKPLALYVFTGTDAVEESVTAKTSSGGVVVNHVWVHLGVPGLPFGGVGHSGMGAYHGQFSFETFTHRKPVLKKPTFVDPKIAYPPYDDFKKQLVKRLL